MTYLHNPKPQGFSCLGCLRPPKQLWVAHRYLHYVIPIKIGERGMDMGHKFQSHQPKIFRNLWNMMVLEMDITVKLVTGLSIHQHHRCYNQLLLLLVLLTVLLLHDLKLDLKLHRPPQRLFNLPLKMGNHNILSLPTLPASMRTGSIGSYLVEYMHWHVLLPVYPILNLGSLSGICKAQKIFWASEWKELCQQRGVGDVQRQIQKNHSSNIFFLESTNLDI